MQTPLIVTLAIAYAIERKFNLVDVFKYINKDLQSRELCLHAIDYDEDILEYIREDILDEEFYKQAVRVHPSALEHIPEHAQTYHVCMSALHTDESVVKFIKNPKRLRANMNLFKYLELFGRESFDIDAENPSIDECIVCYQRVTCIKPCCRQALCAECFDKIDVCVICKN